MPAEFLDDDESLDGVFLTHAHTDHYSNLGQTLSASADTPLYTSPGTAELLEQAYTEADRYRDIGDADRLREALAPIDDWTSLGDGIFVLPVPAGHTPGGVGFLFRIDDPPNSETVTVLTTGDFTLRPTGEYPGLTIPSSIDIDVMIANAVTEPDFETDLGETLETVLERALSGATTLVAAGALTGVHVAYLLDEIDRQLPIHLAGQAAKFYTSLEYDVPFVTAHPEFDHVELVFCRSPAACQHPDRPVRRAPDVSPADPDSRRPARPPVTRHQSSPSASDTSTASPHSRGRHTN